MGFDATPAVTADTGLRRYTEELWKALAGREDVEVRAFALGRGRRPEPALPLRRYPLPLRAVVPLWRATGRPRAERLAGPVDVVHNIALEPAPTRRPHVVTVHDTLPITRPELYPPGAGERQRVHLDHAAAADVIVTTCQATAREIVAVTGRPRDRIVVAPLGTMPLGGKAPGPSALAPAEPYVLCVAAITPRKGLETLAQAVALLGGDSPVVLVAGPDWWEAEAVRARVREVDVHGRIRFLGRVDDHELAALYAQAATVCHPSLAEGFGISVLEAMRSGSPVVATALPSVVEVAGDAAVLVPPGDAEALAQQLAAVLADEDLRRALTVAGRARAASFTWAATAEQVVRGYRLAMSAAQAT